jgi:hypothetical protein
MNRFSLAALARLALIVLLVAGFGCRRGDRAETRTDVPAGGTATTTATQLDVTEVRLGRSVGADRRVATETTQFTPRDTIFASVATQGTASNATLTARWSYQDGQVVDETQQTVSPTGPSNTEFHVVNPGGWPAGSYRVEVLVNGRPAQSREFTVQ